MNSCCWIFPWPFRPASPATHEWIKIVLSLCWSADLPFIVFCASFHPNLLPLFLPLCFELKWISFICNLCLCCGDVIPLEYLLFIDKLTGGVALSGMTTMWGAGNDAHAPQEARAVHRQAKDADGEQLSNFLSTLRFLASVWFLLTWQPGRRRLTVSSVP